MGSEREEWEVVIQPVLCGPGPGHLPSPEHTRLALEFGLGPSSNSSYFRDACGNIREDFYRRAISTHRTVMPSAGPSPRDSIEYSTELAHGTVSQTAHLLTKFKGKR